MKSEQKTWVPRAELIAEANSIRVPLGLRPFSATSSGSLWSTFERKRDPKRPHRFLYRRESALARLLAYRPTSQPVNRPATEQELRSGKLVLVTDACSALGLSPNVVYSAIDRLSFPGYRHPVTNRLLVDVQDFIRCAFFRQKSFIDRHFPPARARIIFASRPWIRVGAGAFEKKLYFVPELVRACSRSHPLPQPHQKTSTRK